MKAKLYVEGGGDREALKGQCRRAFGKLLEKAGMRGRMLGVVACGSRSKAYDRFRSATTGDGDGRPMLLVDSEAPVSGASPWDHVGRREGDGWKRPEGVSDDQLHFMVQVMEAWFLADREALAAYFGKGFHEASSPERADIERVPKSDIEPALQRAARGTAKAGYAKGRDSFEILEQLDPSKVRSRSGWAERFFATLLQS